MLETEPRASNILGKSLPVSYIPSPGQIALICPKTIIYSSPTRGAVHAVVKHLPIQAESYQIKAITGNGLLGFKLIVSEAEGETAS